MVQIPCYDEEETLPETLGDLPRQMEGFTAVEWLVVDDGSRDGTARAARRHGADHVIRLSRHLGLAAAFAAGLEASLRVGADVIVNTDADNQYHAEDIQRLVRPILEGRADLVVGERPLAVAEGHGFCKRWISRFGSWVVRLASGTDVRDAPSGFRAMSRAAARRLRVFGRYTYTIETLIQAGCCGLRVLGVPVRVHAPRRPSRLVRGTPTYVMEGAKAILRARAMYRPLRTFAEGAAAAALAAAGAWFWLLSRPHSSAALAAAVIASVVAVGCLAAGILGELVAANRRLLERLDDRLEEEARVPSRSDRRTQ